MTWTVLILLAGLEVKHFVADYLLQPPWLIRGKGDLTAPGGYVHAGIHVIGTLIALLIVQVPWPAIAGILAAEFVVHYAIDFIKYRYGHVDPAAQPSRYWAVHGLDQLFHQLTYVAILGVSLNALGLWR